MPTKSETIKATIGNCEKIAALFESVNQFFKRILQKKPKEKKIIKLESSNRSNYFVQHSYKEIELLKNIALHPKNIERFFFLLKEKLKCKKRGSKKEALQKY